MLPRREKNRGEGRSDALAFLGRVFFLGRGSRGRVARVEIVLARSKARRARPSHAPRFFHHPPCRAGVLDVGFRLVEDEGTPIGSMASDWQVWTSRRHVGQWDRVVAFPALRQFSMTAARPPR